MAGLQAGEMTAVNDWNEVRYHSQATVKFRMTPIKLCIKVLVAEQVSQWSCIRVYCTRRNLFFSMWHISNDLYSQTQWFFCISGVLGGPVLMGPLLMVAVTIIHINRLVM